MVLTQSVNHPMRHSPNYSLSRSVDFFRDPNVPPSWAQLTRLGGDRAAVLFEELRKRVSSIDGLREELIYQSPEWGWGPRYSAGGQVLFSAHILPGALDVSLALDAGQRENILKSSGISAEIRRAIEENPASGDAAVRIRLANRAAVASFSKLVRFGVRIPTALNNP